MEGLDRVSLPALVVSLLFASPAGALDLACRNARLDYLGGTIHIERAFCPHVTLVASNGWSDPYSRQRIPLKEVLSAGLQAPTLTVKLVHREEGVLQSLTFSREQLAQAAKELLAARCDYFRATLVTFLDNSDPEANRCLGRILWKKDRDLEAMDAYHRAILESRKRVVSGRQDISSHLDIVREVAGKARELQDYDALSGVSSFGPLKRSSELESEGRLDEAAAVAEDARLLEPWSVGAALASGRLALAQARRNRDVEASVCAVEALEFAARAAHRKDSRGYEAELLREQARELFPQLWPEPVPRGSGWRPIVVRPHGLIEIGNVSPGGRFPGWRLGRLVGIHRTGYGWGAGLVAGSRTPWYRTVFDLLNYCPLRARSLDTAEREHRSKVAISTGLNPWSMPKLASRRLAGAKDL